MGHHETNFLCVFHKSEICKKGFEVQNLFSMSILHHMLITVIIFFVTKIRVQKFKYTRERYIVFILIQWEKYTLFSINKMIMLPRIIQKNTGRRVNQTNVYPHNNSCHTLVQQKTSVSLPSHLKPNLRGLVVVLLGCCVAPLYMVNFKPQ